MRRGKAVGAGRRRFLASCAALGAAPFASTPAAAEPPPEITKIRLIHDVAICMAPQYLAEEFLRLEGFTQIEKTQQPTSAALASVSSGTADLTMDATPTMVYGVDRGAQYVIIAGIHAGCYELFAHEGIESVRDLKGKRVSVYDTLGGSDHVLLSSMLAYVGIDPKLVTWVPDDASGTAMQRFIERKVDAFMGFAPQPQELRARNIGRVILSMTEDRPWSQYFCCAVAANREFIMRYPVAAKRALRAYLKAADVCANEPERVARYLADKGYESRYDIGLEVLKSLPYARWREASIEDTLRFHALRLHEVGMIKTSPNELIAKNTDWRFLNELKRELKA
jgi:NitT/TauT family transport system substrate-binding protein